MADSYGANQAIYLIKTDGNGNTTGINAAANILSYLETFLNPTNGFINIKMGVMEKAILDVKMLTLLGQEIISEQLINALGIVNKQIDMSAYPTGMYFLQITNNEGIISRKIIKN